MNQTEETPILTVAPDGEKNWQLPNGKFHRLDGPARIFPDGSMHWYEYGLRHRSGGFPACIDNDGKNLEYWEFGQHHRYDGPAVKFASGIKIYYINGIQHRDDGPSEIIPNVESCWRQNGELHRIGGPAVERENGNNEWWEHGVRIE